MRLRKDTLRRMGATAPHGGLRPSAGCNIQSFAQCAIGGEIVNNYPQYLGVSPMRTRQSGNRSPRARTGLVMDITDNPSFAGNDPNLTRGYQDRYEFSGDPDAQADQYGYDLEARLRGSMPGGDSNLNGQVPDPVALAQSAAQGGAQGGYPPGMATPWDMDEWMQQFIDNTPAGQIPAIPPPPQGQDPGNSGPDNTAYGYMDALQGRAPSGAGGGSYGYLDALQGRAPGGDPNQVTSWYKPGPNEPGGSAPDTDGGPGWDVEAYLHRAAETEARATAPAPAPPPGHPPIVEGRRVRSGDISAVIKRTGYDKKTDSLYAQVIVCDAETAACKTLRVEVPLSEIRRKATLAISKRTHKGARTAGLIDDIFGNIKNAANQVVRSVGLNKLGDIVKTVVSSPDFQDALKVGGTIFPPLGISYNAISQAANLVDQHNQGNPAATAQLQVVAQGAAAGDPAAVKAAIAINAISKAAKGGISVDDQLAYVQKTVSALRTDDPAAQAILASVSDLYQRLLTIPSGASNQMQQTVSGWLASRRYRSLPEAMLSVSPDKAARKWYNEGQTAMVDLIKNKKKAAMAGEALSDAETGRWWK